MIAKDQGPIHVLVRFADKGGKSTIAEHEKILARRGAVWIGKLGKHLASRHIESVNKQVRAGIPTYLYLVHKVAGKYQAYRGAVVAMAERLPSNQGNLVPTYYETELEIRDVAFWTKVSKIVHLGKGGLSNLHVAQTRSAVPEALARSMAGFFVVREGEGISLGGWG